jgi:hypothetical protein
VSRPAAAVLDGGSPAATDTLLHLSAQQVRNWLNGLAKPSDNEPSLKDLK